MREPKHTAERRAEILAAVPPDGASVQQIATKLGIQRISAEARLRKYAKAGLIFLARVRRGDAKRAEGWYFSDRAQRDACQGLALKATQGVDGLHARKTPAPARKLKATLPVVVPEHVKTQVLMSKYRGRFDDIEISDRSFSSLKPGQYPAPASEWVKAVAAA